MKILIATGIFPPDIGGPATYSKTMSEEFAKSGHGAMVVTYGDDGESRIKGQKSKQSEPRIKKVSRRYPKGFRHLVYFGKVLWNGRNADIIFSQDPVSSGFPAMIASFILRKKFVVKVVGDYAWEQGVYRYGVKELLDAFLKKKQKGMVRFLSKVQKAVVLRADRIIVPSAYLKSVVRQWGIEGYKITVIPNALFSTFNVKRIGKKKAGTVFLSVGRLVPWKGFSMLIELMDDFPEATLIIVGDGPEYKKLEAESQRRKVKNVLLAGKKSVEGLMDLYQKADIFLLNTGYEGFSHQILEIMAAGIPIITTDAGGNKEIIRDGENALIASYNEKREQHKPYKTGRQLCLY